MPNATSSIEAPEPGSPEAPLLHRHQSGFCAGENADDDNDGEEQGHPGTAFNTRMNSSYGGDGHQYQPQSRGESTEPDSDEEANAIDLSFIWKLTLTAGISGLLFGYDTGVISSTLVSIDRDLSSRELTTLDKSLIASSTSFFALISSPFAGLLGDRLGRRAVILISDALFVLGASWQAFTGSVWGMVFGRSIVGLAVGAASMITPLYISELAPSGLRGRLVATINILITGGQVVAYIVGWVFSHFSHGWRWIVGLGVLPALLQLALIIFLPETPRWLVQAGRDEEARRVLGRLYNGSDYNAGRRAADKVLRNIERDMAAEAEEWARTHKQLSPDNDDMPAETRSPSSWTLTKETWLALIQIPGNRRAATIACVLQALQQLCGFNSLMYFSATIFEELGFASPTLTSLLVAISNWLFTFVAFNLIDRLGRRKILLTTIPIMAISLLLTALTFSFMDIHHDASRASNPALSARSTTSTASSIAPFFTLLFITIYCGAYASGIGTIPWQQSELFPLRVRALGSSLATATNYTANFVVGATFLPLVNVVSAGGTFVLYAAVCVGGWVLVYRIYPEMSGLGLEDVRELLAEGWGVEMSVRRFRERKGVRRSSGA